ncbi:MAG TPA: hypothetical protein VML55_18985, partial [Planctomycetaceae bacterium]|nr:hypothetical protein [Planctomycetaceae bacterium]
MDFNPEPFNALDGLWTWLKVFGAVAAIAILVSFLTALVASFREGPKLVVDRLGDGLRDARDTSFGRVMALARLTWREAVRRKALHVFVVFALLFMFAGWFMVDTGGRAELQAKVSTRFVLTTITWLVLPVMLLLACWGLPQDIQSRSIHTVVTKPARRNEIVLGRMLGLIGIATLLLAIMGATGYVWIVRNFPAPAAQAMFTENGDPTDDEGLAAYRVAARLDHRITVDLENAGRSERVVRSNEVELAAALAENHPAWLVKEVQDLIREVREQDRPALVSRVPVYGTLYFTDREGNEVDKGINVGDIWDFRSYIEGATSAAAVWEFEGLTEDRLGDSLVLESHFEAFRTHKGEIDRTLSTQYSVVKDLRTQAARALAGTRAFQRLEAIVQQGDFTSAAAEFEAFADGLANKLERLTPTQFQAAAAGFDRFVRLLEPLEGGERAMTGADELVAASRAAATASRSEDAASLAEALRGLAGRLEQHADELKSTLVDLSVPLPSFEVREFKGNIMPVRRQITYLDEANQSRTVDVFNDLAHGGRLKVVVQCLEPAQYLGMARPDLFVRTPDRPFWMGYAKAIFGVWLMTALIVMIGVTASCFLKGPVATLLAFTLILVGTWFHPFLTELVEGKVLGGGFLESVYRMGKQTAPTVPLEESAASEVMQRTDVVINSALWGIHKIIPN